MDIDFYRSTTSMILSLLAGKHAKTFWISIAVLIFFGSIYIYWSNRNGEISKLASENEQLTQELTIRKMEYQTNLLTMEEALDQQNAAIVKLTENTIAAERIAGDLIREANRKNADLSNKLAEYGSIIDGIEEPQTCQAAIDLAVDVAIDFKWPTTFGETQ